MISGSMVLNRRKRSDEHQKHRRIASSDAALSRDLAQASGGLAIEVTKSELLAATSIITESSSSSLVKSLRSHDYLVVSGQRFHLFICNLIQVTLLRAARSPGKTDTFHFIVDETVINLRVYITANSVTFTLTSPTGNTAI